MGGIEPMGEISLLTFLFIGLPDWRSLTRNPDRAELLCLAWSMRDSAIYQQLKTEGWPNSRIASAGLPDRQSCA